MLKVSELLKATQGKLITPGLDTIISAISIDSRTIKPKQAFIAIKGINFDGHTFIDEAIKKGAKAIIAQSPLALSVAAPKIPFIIVKDTVMALADIARFWRNKFNIPIIAVTGSNGKTTTKDMIAHVLSARFKVLKTEDTKNNQIGLPLTLLNLNSNYDIAVLELGTNHFGEIEYLTRICLPNTGIITNIGSAHLEYLNNLKGVLREKYALIENLKEPYIAILNSDDNLLRKRMYGKTKRPFVLSFGIKNQSDFFASGIKQVLGKLKFRINLKYEFTLNTLGYYNIYNALASVATARTFGIGYPDIVNRLKTYQFPAHRLNLITLKNIKFIDDTYNSNPISLKQALDTLANFRTRGRKIFVMGDMLELGRDKKLWHSKVGLKVKQACDAFITVGRLSKLAAQKARDLGFDIKNIFTCESTQQARDILFKRIALTQDDIVLIKGSRLMKMEEILKV